MQQLGLKPAARGGRRARLALVSSMALAVAMIPGVSASGEDGNIGSNAIEIDENLYPAPATGCTGNDFNATVTGFDWVKNCLANPALTVGTDAAAQKGHWNGLRIVDGIAGGDQDIFLTGGKENDPETWNPGPGSIGSSKYDITQAYLANNTQNAFFGMERRGNNGTTAFDWEFNKLAPTDPTPDNPSDPLYIPDRSEGDVLLTFEMQGSGNSGSATPFRFVFDDPDVLGDPNDPTDDVPAPAPGDSDFDGSYVPAPVTGIDIVINDTATPAAPWGTVDSKGNWTTNDIQRFEFAEASVPLSLLGITQADLCSAVSRFVQVRTRASAVDTSDLKDLTKIFSFEFFEPVNPTQTLSENCDAQFDFASSLTEGTVPNWTFSIDDDGADDPTAVTLSGLNGLTLGGPNDGEGVTTWTASAFSGDVQVNFPDGQDQVTIAVSQNLQDANECDIGSSGSIIVHRGLGITASLTPDCGNVFDYDATATGGTGTKSFAWSFEKEGPAGTWTEVATSTQEDGTIDMDGVTGGGQGTYRGTVTVTDEAVEATGKPACTAQVTTTAINVYDEVTAAGTATADCDAIFAWTATGGGGLAPYDISVQVQKFVDGSWVDQGAPVTFDDDADGAVAGTYDATGSPGTYRIAVSVSDSQTPACTAAAESAGIEVRDVLTAEAAKVNPNGTALSVGLDGEHDNALAGDTMTYLWEYNTGSGWATLPGQTDEDFTYSSFKTQDQSPDDVSWTIPAPSPAAGDYVGRVWVVQLKLTVTRTAGGVECSATSNAVTVKLVEGVDP